MTPYKLIYEKYCHLPLELEHKTYWAIKAINLNEIAAGERAKLKLNELDELRLNSYENVKLYKKRTKRWYDKHNLRRELKEGDIVLLFNSRLRVRLFQL